MQWTPSTNSFASYTWCPGVWTLASSILWMSLSPSPFHRLHLNLPLPPKWLVKWSTPNMLWSPAISLRPVVKNPQKRTVLKIPASTRWEKSCNAKKGKVEPPPLHPGLRDLERAYLIPYLPTWPEPDPSSDVIGFINIRDSKKPVQVHLMRSEMFETSQAIRFKGPLFCKKEEPLPEKASPRKKPGNFPDDPPNIQMEQHTQPHPQKTPEVPKESPQPLDKKESPQNSQGKEDVAPPPVPKPRTVSAGHQ